MIAKAELDKFATDLKAKIFGVLSAHRQVLDAERARKREVEDEASRTKAV